MEHYYEYGERNCPCRPEPPRDCCQLCAPCYDCNNFCALNDIGGNCPSETNRNGFSQLCLCAIAAIIITTRK